MTKQEEISDIRNCIASWMRQRDDMERRFSGVRPSFVSCDLAVLEERISRYKAILAEMEGEAE